MRIRLLMAMPVLVALSFSACKTSRQQGDCKYEGVVKDMSGLDGCKWVIELNDGTRLQPVELADSSFKLSNEQRVKVSYTELKDRMSVCMNGKLVRIDCISAR